ncbi:15191_t:CDS:2, partial [Dentiscutata erythropus]
MKEPENNDIIKKYLAMPFKVQGYFWSTASSQQKLPKISKINLFQNTPLQILQTFDIKEIQTLEEEQVVIQYDSSGKPSILLQNSELLDNIHNSVEYGFANTRGYKEAIK